MYAVYVSYILGIFIFVVVIVYKVLNGKTFLPKPYSTIITLSTPELTVHQYSIRVYGHSCYKATRLTAYSKLYVITITIAAPLKIIAADHGNGDRPWQQTTTKVHCF
jgi:hypothetical protein